MQFTSGIIIVKIDAIGILDLMLDTVSLLKTFFFFFLQEELSMFAF